MAGVHAYYPRENLQFTCRLENKRLEGQCSGGVPIWDGSFGLLGCPAAGGAMGGDDPRGEEIGDDNCRHRGVIIQDKGK
jgi:hypothetical protein